MTDYERQLEIFSFEESLELSQRYFAKYWLSREELVSNWLPVHRKIFAHEHLCGAGHVFGSQFKQRISTGGLLFVKDEFELVMRLGKMAGDRHFAIVEDYDEDQPPPHKHPPLRFKYPISTSWEEINAGGYISLELFGMPHKNYFVFGDSGLWGKYAANDDVFPRYFFGYHLSAAQKFESVGLALVDDSANLGQPPI